MTHLLSLFCSYVTADRFELTDVASVETLQEPLLLALHQYVGFRNMKAQDNRKTESTDAKRENRGGEQREAKEAADVKKESTEDVEKVDQIGELSESEESTTQEGSPDSKGVEGQTDTTSSSTIRNPNPAQRFARLLLVLTDVRSISIQCMRKFIGCYYKLLNFL